MKGRTTFFFCHAEGAYFRIFGYGLSWTKSTYIPFSERMGYRKAFRIGKWRCHWLKRSEIR